MRFIFSQELRQEQRQILTQRMIQSMEILQLTWLQLEQRIEQELTGDSALELGSDSSEESSAGTNSSVIVRNEEDEPSPSEEREPEIQFEHAVEHTTSTEEFAIADDFAQNYTDTIDEAPVRSQNWLEEQDSLRADAFANVECPSETLQDHLLRQLDWHDMSETLQEMVMRVIYSIDSHGYFPYELKDFLGEEHTEEELKLAEEALALVKTLEPIGVGGKDLRECLLLQVSPESEHAEILRILITSHLEDISANRLPSIAKKTDFPLDVVQEAVGMLRHFRPRPSVGFGSNTAPVIFPDVIVEKSDAGKYLVRLENGRIPQLRVNLTYKNLLEHHETDQETKAYIRKKIGAAQWLLDAIEHRRDTLLKVSQAIVNYQVDFFEKGQHALKPLKMQQIADAIDMHVATVSRACDDKWMATPQGVFPFRRFFMAGLTASDGKDDIANDVARQKIQEIIDKEDKKNPLSDEAIVKMLEAEGIQVARRTIVKYRQLLNIPSSRGRRKWD